MSWKSNRLVLAAIVLLGLIPAIASSASGSTIVVPPVTITQLFHFVSDGWASDAVAFPDGSVASQGFTATIAPGDTVRMRFEAPPGKKFVIHGGHGQPGLPEQLFVRAQWTAGLDLVLQNSPFGLSFQAPPLAPISVQYSAVQGGDPGWGTKAPTPDATLMEIVDAGVVPAIPTTWGRLKSLYR